MSSMPRYVLGQCYPSYRTHLWAITGENADGEVNKMKCVHCDQTIRGVQQCRIRQERNGLAEEKEGRE